MLIDEARRAFCPYCRLELIPPPRASGNCPHCGQKMYYRKVAGSDRRRLMTYVENVRNDEAWSRLHHERHGTVIDDHKESIWER